MRSVTWRKTWLVGFLIILFLLQNPLQQHLEPFQYVDEIFGLKLAVSEYSGSADGAE